eukprot:CAMPEP_0182816546 /NCGR_PEP_ID=MMETSP0006_2-20121128/10994_1 /TAXON_ID=97485 /ORGANISM="Prymnesium parvum, Strain Texoma1" /LENGTH=97 /DNA_ID=CAMNT_0024942843 /DNA_START=359 /DNA_END=649 /DNA_ORIENTATION=-
MEPFSDTPIVVQNPTTKQSCTWSELFLAALGALGELVDVLASLLALARDGLRDTLAHAALVALAKLPVVRAALGAGAGLRLHRRASRLLHGRRLARH